MKNTVVFGIFSGIFLYVIIGYGLGRIRNASIRGAIDVLMGLVTYLVVPVFIVTSVWSVRTGILPVLKISGVAAAVIATGGLFAAVFSKRYGLPFREACLPIMFMNSAFMAIPLNTLFFGKEGAVYAIVYNTVMMVLLFTLGIYLVSRKSGLSQVFKMPIIYAAVAGLGLNLAGAEEPVFLVKFSGILNKTACSLMLVLVGYQMDLKSRAGLKLAFIGSLFRYACGFSVSVILVMLFSMKGAMAGTAVLSSTMPAAVFTYMVAQKYDSNPEFAASVIFIGTVLSVGVISLMGVVFARVPG